MPLTIKPTLIVTAKWLRERGACKDQIEVFEREWPFGADVTAANIRHAAKLGLNVGWFVCEYLEVESRCVYYAAALAVAVFMILALTETLGVWRRLPL